jgi:hypothetical protein
MENTTDQYTKHKKRSTITQTPVSLHLTVLVVIGVDHNLRPLLKEIALSSLLKVLYVRARRLVRNHEIREQLQEPLYEFVYNIVQYFASRQMLDNYTLTNLATALICADAHGTGHAGPEDFSTFIRRLNPTDPGTDSFFILGREGKADDPQCPIRTMDRADLQLLSDAQLHMYLAFYHARLMNAERGAPRIPIDDIWGLIPQTITNQPILEEAFLDVCFSDGAWELYHRNRGETRC